MRLKTVLSCLLLGLWTLPGAAEQARLTAEEIRDCSRRNFPARTAVQAFALKSVDASGTQTNQRGKMRWRRTEAGLAQINICFSEPSRLNGSCYLVIERETTDDIFVFLPSLNRVKRVLGGATAQTLVGTDISYADLKQLQGVAAGGSLEQLEDGQVENQPVYLLQGRPDPKQESPYTRVVSHVDQDTCVPLQVDFYGLGDKLRKRLHVRHESLRQMDSRWVIHDMVLRDVHNNTRTEIQFEDVEYDSELASRIFNRRSFYMAP